MAVLEVPCGYGCGRSRRFVTSSSMVPAMECTCRASRWRGPRPPRPACGRRSPQAVSSGGATPV